MVEPLNLQISTALRTSPAAEADVLRLQVHAKDLGSVETPLLFQDNFQYLAAERIGPRVTYASSDFMVRQKRRLGNTGEFTAHFLWVFGEDEVQIQTALHPSARNTQLKGQIEAWLSEIAPGTQVHVTYHHGMDLVNLEFSFVHGTLPPSDPYRATNVGFGLTYILPVLTALLSSQPGDLLIIENPEAHLHPRGQRKLGELLALVAQAGVQVVVESHSDHLLNGIRLAVYNKTTDAEKVKLLYFAAERSKDRKSTSVVEPKIDVDGRIDNWPTGFFDEWDIGMEALLAPRSV